MLAATSEEPRQNRAANLASRRPLFIGYADKVAFLLYRIFLCHRDVHGLTLCAATAIGASVVLPRVCSDAAGKRARPNLAPARHAARIEVCLREEVRTANNC